MLRFLNPVVTAIFLAAASAAILLAPTGAVQAADGEDVAHLLEELADPDQERWQRIERQIVAAWSRSGSPALDLLLRRGRAALQEGDSRAALEHLTALTDHAPEFAEGWNARATAHFRTGNYGPAMADISQALALNPSHYGAMAGMALILEDVGAYEQAYAVFEAAHAIHPHHPAIRRALERLAPKISGSTL